jgi:hypothetical protein
LRFAKPFGKVRRMNKPAVIHITDTLTAPAIMARLGVSSHMIRHARTTGVFPASWYAPVKAMADEVGIPCPLSAFNWKATGDALNNPTTREAEDGSRKNAGAA